ncbi:MAG: sodium:solute symporter [Bacteroidota bacterium]
MIQSPLNSLDWLVLLGTIFLIVAWGVWRTRNSHTADAFLAGDRKAQWWAIGLSIMATQASAITFLSIPGQAYTDGFRFVQAYFGLPLAMIVLCVTAVPIFSRLKILTAYEYLETRFDIHTRTLAAGIFLIQRGLSTGITIAAPSIVLSTVLGWNLNITIVFIGIAVMVYTVAGGNKAVSVTHKQQMLVIFFGMGAAAYTAVKLLPDGMGIIHAAELAGHLGKMNALDTHFDLNQRYNLWSGLIGGFFMQLSYFGTDQSQVARYISGDTITESRMGLIMNGLLKIPMQIGILSIGVLLFIFWQFNAPPLFFNRNAEQKVLAGPYAAEYKSLQAEHLKMHGLRVISAKELHNAESGNTEAIPAIKAKMDAINVDAKQLKNKAISLINKTDPGTDPLDNDYVFLTFVLDYLPHGLLGLLLAVIFCAAMSSTSSALSALGTATTIDIHKRLARPQARDSEMLKAGQGYTLLWGIVAMAFAMFAGRQENLIQAVNILGSLFYGSILGIFLCGFYVPYIKGRAVFAAALLAEIVVLLCFKYSPVSFLWYNAIGCLLVPVFGFGFQLILNSRKNRNIEAGL